MHVRAESRTAVNAVYGLRARPDLNAGVYAYGVYSTTTGVIFIYLQHYPHAQVESYGIRRIRKVYSYQLALSFFQFERPSNESANKSDITCCCKP